MTSEEIFTGLTEIFRNIKPSLDVTSVGPDTELVTDLALDSLSLMLLSLAAETKFGFTFDGTPQFVTVGDVVNFIAERVNESK